MADARPWGLARLRKLQRRAAERWRFALEHRVRTRLVAPRVRHVAGPREVSYGERELLAICVVRNGAAHVRSFLEHHLGLGVRHVVLLDNGSSDGTVEIAAENPRVTVLATGAPYRVYENALKRYLARRFSRGRWNLCVDIDERFDYPFSATLPLAALLAYLDRRGFTAVVAQMLDLFSAEPLGTLPPAPGEDPARRFAFYDLSGVYSRPYRWGTLSDPAVRDLRGGIRDQVFGTANGLSKAALVRVDPGTELFVDYHHVGRAARVADFTCVLYHYPFEGAFRQKVEEAVRSGSYGPLTTPQYESYLQVLRGQEPVSLARATARELRGTAELLDAGFLVASNELRRWAAAHGRPDGSMATRGAHGG